MQVQSTPRPAQLQLVLRPLTQIPGLHPEYVLSSFPATVGRHPTNDIELPLEAVSRYHARIELSGGAIRLVDLRSSNGCMVNGDRIQNHYPIKNGDLIGFGSLEFELSVKNDANFLVSDSEESSQSQTSVTFIKEESSSQVVYQAELSDDTSQARVFQNTEITNESQLRRAQQRLLSFYKLQEILRNTSDLKQMLKDVLNMLFEVIHLDRGVILLRDDNDPDSFRPIAIRTRKPGKQDIGISKTILQRSLSERVAILVRDSTADPRFQDAESLVAKPTRSVICAPLISQRHVFGFCHLDTADAVRSFTEDDLAFMATMGTEIALRLHNARMLQEQILSERMAAVGQTIMGMAHNIKNILVLSHGGVEMMEKRINAQKFDQLEDTWLVVRRGLNRINGLVQDMLDYSRVREVKKSPVDIAAAIREINQTFTDELNTRHVEAILDLDTSWPHLRIDPGGFDKALCNLILNALEAFSDGAGQIMLRTRRGPEEQYIVEVADTAGGMDEEVLQRIFIPFFSTKGKKGTGLGLAMTKKFIEDMGGHIEVHTEKGKGTCFSIVFPCSAAVKMQPAADV